MQHRNSLKKTPFLHSRVIFIRLARSWSTFYSYSHLSPGIRHVIFKATHPEPTKRYTNVEEMKKAFGASRYIDRSVQVIKGIAAVTVILLAYYGLREEPPTRKHYNL